mgnify:CR=1 FL=1
MHTINAWIFDKRSGSYIRTLMPKSGLARIGGYVNNLRIVFQSAQSAVSIYEPGASNTDPWVLKFTINTTQVAFGCDLSNSSNKKYQRIGWAKGELATKETTQSRTSRRAALH